jgi:carbohydrate-selective porin OprB
MKRNLPILSAIVPLLASCLFPSAFAQDLRSDSAYMLGDWGGERTRLANRGVTLNLIYVDDLLSDTHHDVANWSRVRATFDIDLEKAQLVQGLKFHITAMWQAGSNLGAHLGAIANPSSLASINLIRLDSWWFEQSLANKKVFLRLGQFAGLDSYGVQPYGDSFINEPLGYAMGNLISANYETFAPAATPAFEVRYVPSQHFYMKSAIFSGNRNPFHDDENGLHFKFKDAPVIAAEAGYTAVKEYSGSYAFGTTINTGPFSNIVTGDRSRTNYLVYVTANQQIYQSPGHRTGGMDAAFSFDWSPEKFTKAYLQLAGGLRYHGVFRRREHDTTSVGFVYTRTSEVLNRSLTQTGLPSYGAEKLLEVNYAAQVNRWLTFQPVFEYYFDRGANPRLGNSVVIGFRTLIVL